MRCFPLALSVALSVALSAVFAFPAVAQEASIHVQAKDVVSRPNRLLTGMCIEDVNHEIYGGIYSQMIFGESFQEAADPCTGVSGMWSPFCCGRVKSQFRVECQNAFLGRQSQRLTFRRGDGVVGIANFGLNRWGLNFVKGKPYEGCIWLRAESAIDVVVSLQSADAGTVYSQETFSVTPCEWQRFTFTLTPNADDKAGAFGVSLTSHGSVVVGYASLHPGQWGRYKGLAVRRDVVEGLLAANTPVLRYGGSMVNASEYRWKKMIGPRDQRPPYKGTWYPIHDEKKLLCDTRPLSSNGWGIVDFLELCEAMNVVGIPAFNMNETPADMADFLDYCEGDAGGRWGARRAADGHPAPLKLVAIELGNEERVDESYFKKFKPLAEAIWAKNPRLILVVGDFVYEKKITDPMKITGAVSKITDFSAHQKILKLAKQHNAEVWFDIHVGTEKSREKTLKALPTVQAALEKLADGANWKLAVFELNSNIHSQQRALANAVAIGTLQRNGRLAVVCSANALQPDKQNDNGWNQGLVFLNPSQVWLQPPAYVGQMIARSPLSRCVRADAKSPDDCLDVTALADEAGKTLELHVVNLKSKPVKTKITVADFLPRQTTAMVETLAADPKAANTAETPNAITPQKSEWRCHLGPDGDVYEFPANSFTIVKFE